MTKRSFYIIIEVIIGVIIYYLLSTLIEDRLILMGSIVLAGILFVVVRAYFIRNDADLLEIGIDPDKYFEHIKQFENRDINRYNTLYMYGLTYTGEYDQAELLLSKIMYQDIRTSRNLHYDYYVSKLHLLYNKDERQEYRKTYEEAVNHKVFQKVGVPKDTFLAHLLLLEGNSEKALEILKTVIPVIKKKVLVIELEYILAKAYHSVNKMDDCKAVCDFIANKNHPVVYTEMAKELVN